MAEKQNVGLNISHLICMEKKYVTHEDEWVTQEYATFQVSILTPDPMFNETW